MVMIIMTAIMIIMIAIIVINDTSSNNNNNDNDYNKTLSHIHECPNLVQNVYKRQHDWIGRSIHWEML